MRAMVLDGPGTSLRSAELPAPEPSRGEILVRVLACAVCRTDLHVIDRELARPKLPLVLGHQVVGEVVNGGERHAAGSRIGIPWLGWTCGECRFCLSERENLCVRARFTGYDVEIGRAHV